ncbi:unnamed protein product [Caenorhabditis auriculariae]|uniref:BED-type domain-containing protein n=1 Tax=Caenorhabditis auriculariae TaxID=2777116 RepID=A0A8S1GSH8_9PELO|nr:unnamed protein product [Caenorhabditis auriculariae]
MGLVSHLYDRKDGKFVCKICKKEYVKSKSGSTFSLINHIKKLHPHDYEKAELISGRPRKKPLQTLDSPLAGNEQMTESFFEPQKLAEDGEESSEITRAITEMIVIDLMPFSTVQKKGFRQLLSILKPNYRLPSRWSFTRTELPQLHALIRERVQEELDAAEHVVICFDLWSDEGSLHEVFGVFAYFLKEKTVVQRLIGVINSREQCPTEVNIANKTKELLDEFGITTKVVAAVRDGASNAVKACDVLPYESFDCLNHNIHLAAAEGIKTIIGLSEVLENYKKIVRKLKKSSLDQKGFERIQEVLEESKLHLTKNSPLRWCHLRDMFVRALRCKESISILLERRPDLPQLSESDWSLMESTCKLLKPLSDQSDVQRRGSSASAVIPICHYLVHVMRNRTDEPSLAIAERMASELNKYERTDYLLVSTFLDPQYKERTNPRPKTAAQIDIELAARIELDRFLAMPVEVDSNAVDFWTNPLTISQLPLFSRHAMKYIICPPGSGEIERVFSTESCDKLRKSLSVENFEKLLFLSKNLPLMK